jgi:phosphate transport system substrate-binding protein
VVLAAFSVAVFVVPLLDGGSVADRRATRAPGAVRRCRGDVPGGALQAVVQRLVLLYKSYSDPRKAAALRELFRWCLTTGQRAAPDLGYLELPPSVVARALAVLETVAPAG